MRRFHSPSYLLLGLLLVAGLQAFSVVTGASTAYNGGAWDTLWDSDSYSRLLRVRELWRHGNWYDPRLPMLNAPEGLIIHWTRPLDIMLLIPAWIGSWFMPFPDALHNVGLAFGPLIHFAFVPVLSWATRPLFSDRAFVAALFCLILSRGLLNHNLIGAVDYHGLVDLMQIATLGFLIRHFHEPDRRNYLAGGALLGAFAVWNTPECALFLAPAWATLALLWVMERGRHLDDLRRVAMIFTLALAAALAIERPPSDWFNLQPDRLSALHVGIGAVGWLALEIWCQGDLDERRFGIWPVRLGFAAVALAALALFCILLFPELEAGRFGKLDPLVQKLLIEDVQTEVSFIPHNEAGVVWLALDMGMIVPALAYIAWRWRKAQGAERHRLLLYLLGLAVCVPYALKWMRGGSSAEAAALLPWAEVVVALAGYASARTVRWARIAFAASAGLVLFGHTAFAYAWASRLENPITLGLIVDCPYDLLDPYIDQSDPERGKKTMLTYFYHGPEIAYRFGYSAIGAPYHGNGAGIGDSHRLWADPPGIAVSNLARRRNLEYIALCRMSMPYPPEFYYGNPWSMVTRLAMAQPPAWIEPVPLPPEIDRRFQLFRVKR